MTDRADIKVKLYNKTNPMIKNKNPAELYNANVVDPNPTKNAITKPNAKLRGANNICKVSFPRAPSGLNNLNQAFNISLLVIKDSAHVFANFLL